MDVHDFLLLAFPNFVTARPRDVYVPVALEVELDVLGLQRVGASVLSKLARERHYSVDEIIRHLQQQLANANNIDTAAFAAAASQQAHG